MNLSIKPWVLGLLIMIVFAVLGELSLVFNEYVFHRLGFDRNLFMVALWVLPFIASFIAARYSVNFKSLAGLSYMLLFPFIGSLAHYINGELGGVVDFTGFSGALAVFKIYFVIGGVLILMGTFLGVAFSNNRNKMQGKRGQ